MDSNQQLELFLNAIDEAAENESLEIRRQADEFRSFELNNAKEIAAESAKAYVKFEGNRHKVMTYSTVFDAGAKFRKEVHIEKSRIVSRISEAVLDKVKSFVESQDYIDFIEKSLKKITEVFDGDDFELYCNSNTFDKCKNIINNPITNSKIVFDETIIVGGLRAFCESKNIMIDDTLDSRFEKHIDMFFVD